jgi:hypothetical protein
VRRDESDNGVSCVWISVGSLLRREFSQSGLRGSVGFKTCPTESNLTDKVTYELGHVVYLGS